MKGSLAAVALAALALAPVALARDSAAARWIVFSATPPASHTEQLFRIQTTGDGLEQLTTGFNPSIQPAFSPDGKRIAFSRTGVGLQTVGLDGSGLHRLTTNARDSFPVWSPDGRQVAFIRPAADGWQTWVVAPGRAPKELKHAPPAGRPSWTKAGLLIPSGGDLLRINPANGRVQKYYGASIDAVWGMDTTAVAPNSSILSYIGTRASDSGDMECGEGACQRYALYIESLLTTKKRPQLIFKDVGPAAFSPDGKQLAFAAHNQLEIAPRGGGATRALPTGEAVPTITAPPTWQPR